ncbi:hypothetical protein QZH41_006990 [Actinostola sp. cb2023]|nr:hypothetical protein QZH41_006990 [Actinostola sp. cb2023]
MWGFDWSYLRNLVRPFPKTPDPDISKFMTNMTVIDMVKIAEHFYVSMGLEKMNENFWEKSLFSHDPGQNVDCTVTAWDFAPGDYRIKMPCALVNENELMTVIHEMGHIQYDMMYAKQPFSFRNGANPAFHEAVGDALTLSARSPSFLDAVGLMDKNLISDEKSDLFVQLTKDS